MKKVLIEIMYNGKNFAGWQIQNAKNKTQRTVEGELEKILSCFLSEKIILHASGRTDAGVHAKSQFAHFETNSKMNFDKLPQALASLLPNDISVPGAKVVPDDFHARYSVREKTYHYMCYISSVKNVFLDDIAMRLKHEPDTKKMQEAMEYFVGTHDFSSFAKPGRDVNRNDCDEDLSDTVMTRKKTNIRTVSSFELEKKDNILTFKITGNGFLHNMVRIIIGTVLEVGEGRRQPEDMREILNKKDRIYAGKTAKANGLMLYGVKY